MTSPLANTPRTYLCRVTLSRSIFDNNPNPASEGDAFYVEKEFADSVAIHGKATQAGSTGVYGENTGKGFGVYGKATSGAGVLGESIGWIGMMPQAISSLSDNHLRPHVPLDVLR